MNAWFLKFSWRWEFLLPFYAFISCTGLKYYGWFLKFSVVSFYMCLLLCTVSVTRGTRILHWSQIIPFVGVCVHRTGNVASNLIHNDRLVENRCKMALALCDSRNSFFLFYIARKTRGLRRFHNKKDEDVAKRGWVATKLNFTASNKPSYGSCDRASLT